jgi:pyridoxamine 5'-phosphate oxidase
MQPTHVTILPDVEEPLRLVECWLDEAATRCEQPNPNAMTLATVAVSGRPSARVVLIKGLDCEHGYVVFYTNYSSRKAIEIGDGRWVAGVVHWDALGRQIRFEGPAVKSPEPESNAYFSARPWRSQINAWASHQSKPLDEPRALEARAREVASRFDAPDPFGAVEPRAELAIARPAFWGGFRLWLGAVEFWASGRDRFHERLRFERILDPAGTDGFVAGAWRSHRLQP